MTDLVWPSDLRPSTMAFYLQPHTGGQESPLTRTRKVYGLSAPRWIAKMTFTASWRGGRGTLDRGPRLDALIAQMEGGLNRVALWDMRRGRAIRWQPPKAGTVLTSVGALAGATSMDISGFSPGAVAFSIGDYVGGDDRAHLVVARSLANAAGVATVQFLPPLSAAVTAGSAAVVREVSSMFRITSEDAGLNQSTANGQASYSLEFTEDLGQ